ACDENDRREPSRRITLETAAHLETVQGRHGDVEEDHVGVMPRYRRERGFPIGHAQYLMAVRRQQPLEHHADALGIVNYQHAAPPGCGRNWFVHGWSAFDIRFAHDGSTTPSSACRRC